MAKILTEAELEVMTALWQAGSCGVHGVRDALPPERELAYTTVATTLRILQDKGFVTSKKNGRSLIFTPSIEREAYERRGVRHLVERLFGGDPVSLVRSLVGGDLTEEELEEAERVLRTARGEDA